VRRAREVPDEVTRLCDVTATTSHLKWGAFFEETETIWHGAVDDVLFCELLLSAVTSLMTFIDCLRFFLRVFLSVWFVFDLGERFF